MELSVPEIIKRLYCLTDELHRRYSDRHFTLDGHLVGSIGEALAAERYDLDLLSASTEGHDARAKNGDLVQIKITQKRTIGLRSEPRRLLVLALDREGSITEVYNGPGAEPWREAGPMQRNGQRQLGLGRLERIMEAVPVSERIPVTGAVND